MLSSLQRLWATLHVPRDDSGGQRFGLSRESLYRALSGERSPSL